MHDWQASIFISLGNNKFACVSAALLIDNLSVQMKNFSDDLGVQKVAFQSQTCLCLLGIVLLPVGYGRDCGNMITIWLEVVKRVFHS